MIEKIIVQDSSEVHSVWIPERKSLASFVVWKAFGLGSHGRWADGQITLGVSAEWENWPAFPEFPGFQDETNFPDAVGLTIAHIDACLPSTHSILAALDPDSITTMPDPPAFRMPYTPYAQDAATCLLATRVLLAIRERLTVPADMTAEEFFGEIVYASKIAALLAGDEAVQIAINTMRSTDFTLVLPKVNEDDDLIIQENADD